MFLRIFQHRIFYRSVFQKVYCICSFCFRFFSASERQSLVDECVFLQDERFEQRTFPDVSPKPSTCLYLFTYSLFTLVNRPPSTLCMNSCLFVHLLPSSCHHLYKCIYNFKKNYLPMYLESISFSKSCCPLICHFLVTDGKFQR